MKTDNSRVTVFSHLPKTGGTTLLANIQRHRQVGEDLFHVSYNGRKHAALCIQCEDALESRTPANLVLAGHSASEGFLSLLAQSADVDLVTTLRHPLSRAKSHFSMKKSSVKGFNGDFSGFLREGNNPMCRHYISRFPSLIGSPFLTLAKQAENVLSHFSMILFQENAATDFPRFINSIGGKFDSKLSRNRAGIDYADRTQNAKFSPNDLDVGLSQDLSLYERIASSTSQGAGLPCNPLPTPTAQHCWWRNLLRRLQRENDEALRLHIHNTLAANRILFPATAPEIDPSKMGRRAALAVIDNIEWIEGNPARLANALEVLTTFGVPKRPISNGPLARLLQKSLDAKCETLKRFVDGAWLDLQPVHLDIILAQGHQVKSEGCSDKAKALFLRACQLAPINPPPFVALGKLAHQTGDMGLAVQCAQKLQELSSSSTWAASILRRNSC